jgi:hypothetical protein
VLVLAPEHETFYRIATVPSCEVIWRVSVATQTRLMVEKYPINSSVVAVKMGSLSCEGDDSHIATQSSAIDLTLLAVASSAPSISLAIPWSSSCRFARSGSGDVVSFSSSSGSLEEDSSWTTDLGTGVSAMAC